MCGTHVVIELSDPDGRIPLTGIEPLAGVIIRTIRNPYGQNAALVELDTPLPAGFDPLSSHDPDLPEGEARHLLLDPSPAMPTRQIPVDYIASSLAGPTARAKVLVSRVFDPRLLEKQYDFDLVEKFSFLAAGWVRSG